MDDYLELIKLVLAFSLHIDDKEEIIANISEIKIDLFKDVKINHYYGLNIVKDGTSITVSYYDEDKQIRIENNITIEKQ